MGRRERTLFACRGGGQSAEESGAGGAPFGGVLRRGGRGNILQRPRDGLSQTAGRGVLEGAARQLEHPDRWSGRVPQVMDVPGPVRRR